MTTVFLAWLGIYSEGLHSPAVVMGNLCGGFAMLGIFGWLVFDRGGGSIRQSVSDRSGWIAMAIGILCVQILLGGLTSANFAAGACQTLPHCRGEWFPGANVWTAFDLSRSMKVNDFGVVIGGAERAGIHMLHRLISLLTVAMVLAVGVLAYHGRQSPRPVAIFVCIVVALEFLIGVTAIQSSVPVGVAVAHNWLAGLLLLGLLRLRAG